MRRSIWLLAAAVGTLSFAVVAASAAPPTNMPRTKAEALKSYHADPGEVSSDPVPVSLAEAAAAAALPGAVTEGQIPFLGMKPADPAAPVGGVGIQSSEGGGGGNACWWVERNNSIGLGGFGRSAVVQTYWCAVYGHYITYRTSNTFGRTSGLCHQNGPGFSVRISGGVGYRWVKIHAEVPFQCQAILYGINLYDSVWLRPEYNVWGSSNDGEKN